MSDKTCISPLATRPVLYTDTLCGEQTCRDDLWAVTTDELNALHRQAAATDQPSAGQVALFEEWAKKEDFWPVEKFAREEDAYLDDDVHTCFVAFKAGLARAFLTPTAPDCTEPNRKACPRLCADFCNAAEQARMKCDDCDGRGHDGDFQWQGHFQPPEPGICNSCGGTGWAEPVTPTAPQAASPAHEAMKLWDSLPDVKMPQAASQQADTAIRLLREAHAALETWKDVAPAVSLCADIEKFLAPQAATTAIDRYMESSIALDSATDNFYGQVAITASGDVSAINYGNPVDNSAATTTSPRCTCPSGDGSLRWPCPAHPPEAAMVSASDAIMRLNPDPSKISREGRDGYIIGFYKARDLAAALAHAVGNKG